MEIMIYLSSIPLRFLSKVSFEYVSFVQIKLKIVDQLDIIFFFSYFILILIVEKVNTRYQ